MVTPPKGQGWAPKSDAGRRVLKIVVAIGFVAVSAMLIYIAVTTSWSCTADHLCLRRLSSVSSSLCW